MTQKLIFAAATAVVIGVLAATGNTVDAGHGHHGHHHHGNRGYNSSYYGGGYYGGGVVLAPRVYAAPAYPVYPSYGYGAPCGGSPYGYGYNPGYGYGGYAPYGQALGVRSGNFSLFLGR